MSAEQAAVQAPPSAPKGDGLSTKANVFIGLGAYLAVAVLLLLLERFLKSEYLVFFGQL